MSFTKGTNQIHFSKDNITYYYIGQPTEYYYDLSMNTLDEKPCQDILEKTRFIYALWEEFLLTTFKNEGNLLPSGLITELKEYFSKYDEADLAYWALLQYETLEDYDTNKCIYQIDNVNKNLILSSREVKIIIPPPYENLIGEDVDGQLFDVDDCNFNDFKFLYYDRDNTSPILFMSEEQHLRNELEIDQLYQEILLIFNRHNIFINSCEELVLFHNCFK